MRRGEREMRVEVEKEERKRRRRRGRRERKRREREETGGEEGNRDNQRGERRPPLYHPVQVFVWMTTNPKADAGNGITRLRRHQPKPPSPHTCLEFTHE
jgi:hypothetical protein